MRKRCNADHTQAVEGIVIPVTPSPPRLKTIRACRLEMAAVYADMRANRLDSRDGARLIYCLTAISTTIRDDEIEARVLKIEEAMQDENRS